jgi:hypothetical protein
MGVASSLGLQAVVNFPYSHEWELLSRKPSQHKRKGVSVIVNGPSIYCLFHNRYVGSKQLSS